MYQERLHFLTYGPQFFDKFFEFVNIVSGHSYASFGPTEEVISLKKGFITNEK